MSSPTTVIITIPFVERYGRSLDKQPIVILNKILREKYEHTDRRGFLTCLDLPRPNAAYDSVYSCVFDYLDLPSFLQEIIDFNWYCPEGVHLLIQADWMGHSRFHHCTAIDLIIKGIKAIPYER